VASIGRDLIWGVVTHKFGVVRCGCFGAHSGLKSDFRRKRAFENGSKTLDGAEPKRLRMSMITI
jgi:hypothetical protein